MDKLIVFGFLATSAAMVLGVRIPSAWEWYYFPVGIAIYVALICFGRALKAIKELGR